MQISIQNTIDEMLAKKGDPRGPKDCWYVTDYGRCPRGAYLERQGTANPNPPDERTMRVFKMGYMVEDFVVEALKNKGIVLSTQESVVYPEIGVRGRSDVVISDKGDAQLVEVKSMHSAGFHWRLKSGFQPLEHHKAQALMYMGKLREKYTESLKACICYVSKDDLLIQQIPVQWDEDEYNEIINHFKELERCWKAQELPELISAVVFDEQKKKWQVNWKAKYCGHHAICTGDDEWELKANAEVKRLNKLIEKPKKDKKAEKIVEAIAKIL
jgi:hypothetical protein